MNNQPLVYVARPVWERDEVRVFSSLVSLVQGCNQGMRLKGPHWYRIFAFYADGQEVPVPEDRYTVVEPASRDEADDFVRWRSQESGSDLRRFAGMLRANPDLPLEEQVEEYIAKSPRRWKRLEELEGDGNEEPQSPTERCQPEGRLAL